jgi:hypothetical protein
MLKYSIGATDPVWCELMRQISRLEQMDRFPFGPEAKKDLGDALSHCDSLTEAREVIDEFVNDARAGVKCPLFGDIREVIAQRRSRNVIPIRATPVEYTPSANYCGRCQNCGFYGGHLDGRYAGPWKWCDCQAGKLKQREEPAALDEMNAKRETLIRRFAAVKKPEAKTAKTDLVSVADEYHGAF